MADKNTKAGSSRASIREEVVGIAAILETCTDVTTTGTKVISRVGNRTAASSAEDIGNTRIVPLAIKAADIGEASTSTSGTSAATIESTDGTTSTMHENLNLKVEVLMVHEDCLYYTNAIASDINNDNFIVYMSDGSVLTSSYGQCRLPPLPYNEIVKPVKGERYEVFVKIPGVEYPGWFICLVEEVHNTHCKIIIPSETLRFSQIVSKSKLRHLNKNKPLDPKRFFRYDIDIPAELHDYCKVKNVHKELFKVLGNMSSIEFKEDTGKLLILSAGYFSDLAFNILVRTHIKNLRQKFNLQKNIEKVVKCYESVQLHSEMFVDVINIPENLMKYVLEHRTSLLYQANKIEGVNLVIIQTESHSIKVIGTSEEALRKVRDILELKVEIIMVPQIMVEKVLGKNATILQEIADKCQLRELQFIVNTDVVNYSNIVMTASKVNIEHAKAYLWFHVQHLKEMEHLASETTQLHQMLASICAKFTNSGTSAAILDEDLPQPKLSEQAAKPSCFDRVIIGKPRQVSTEQLLEIRSKPVDEAASLPRSFECQLVYQRAGYSIAPPQVGGAVDGEVAVGRRSPVVARSIGFENISPAGSSGYRGRGSRGSQYNSRRGGPPGNRGRRGNLPSYLTARGSGSSTNENVQ